MQIPRKISRFFLEFWRHFFHAGPLVAAEFVFNRFGTWDITDLLKYSETEIRNSSLSDTPQYLLICTEATKNTKVLTKFKSEKNYMRILEHVDYFLGRQYLEVIKKDSALINNLKRVASTEIGGPKKYSYPRIGRVSPTQIRYAKVLGDLEKLFGSLDGLNIAEIGVGNGGQGIHICNKYSVNSYTFFDLPEVQGLVKVILKNSGLTGTFNFPDIFDLREGNFDLIIANYSFSELRVEDQGNYLSKIIISCKRGYMILNDIKPEGMKTVSSEELLEMIPGSRVVAEIPESHPANRLIYWGALDSNLIA